jgi:hypothetical protein
MQKARSGIGNAARDLLKAHAKVMDGAAILRHLSILLIFATVYNSDGVGLPILPPSSSESAETNEQLEGAAFQAISSEGCLAAFATLSVRNHEVVATIEYDAPPADCNPPNTMSDSNTVKTKYNFLSIANPEMAPKNVKESLMDVATSTSTTGEGKRKPEGKHFYTLTPSGPALDLMSCQDVGEWWDYIW